MLAMPLGDNFEGHIEALKQIGTLTGKTPRPAARLSAKLFHQHDVAAALICLRVENPPAIGRNGEAPYPRVNRSIDGRDLPHVARCEAEELDDGTRRHFGGDEIDALLGHCPGTPEPGPMMIDHGSFHAAFHRNSPPSSGDRQPQICYVVLNLRYRPLVRAGQVPT